MLPLNLLHPKKRQLKCPAGCWKYESDAQKRGLDLGAWISKR